MEIWIRSQDKCEMAKCTEIYIDDYCDGDYMAYELEANNLKRIEFTEF